MAAGLMVAALIGLVVFDRIAQARERAEQDAAEGTAWDNRLEMDQVLVDTALLLGVEGEVQPERRLLWSACGVTVARA